MTKQNKYLIIGIPVAVIVLFFAAFIVSELLFPVSGLPGAYPQATMMNRGIDEDEAGYDFAVSESMPMMEEAYYGGEAIAVDKEFMPPMPPYDTAGVTAAEVDQKIIKTGSLDIVVDDVDKVATDLTSLASAKGGFVQTSSVSERKDGTKFGNVTLRVPAGEFENTVRDIKAMANLVQNESVSGQDVTEEYTDLQAQLRNAEAQEQTYLMILEQAESVEDILNIQRELGYIRGQIESLKGRLQYLENKTSYSTISVSLSEEPTVSLPTKEFRPWTIVNEAAQALVAIGQRMVEFAIWFVVVGGGILIPVAIIISIVVAVIKRFRSKGKKK